MKKRCCSCKEYKYTDEFPKDKSQKDGLNSRCKDCVNERNRRTRNHDNTYLSEVEEDIRAGLRCAECTVVFQRAHERRVICRSCYDMLPYQGKRQSDFKLSWIPEVDGKAVIAEERKRRCELARLKRAVA